MRLAAFTLLSLCCVLSKPVFAADRYLVRDGKANAEIVIAETPPRTTRLAAIELQTYVAKISGAKLPIVTDPDPQTAIQIFVGQSKHAQQHKITAEGLKNGAYRIVSGDHWLALIGDDTDFSPIEPWARSNNDIVSGKVQAEFDKITGAHWGYPLTQMRKHYTGRVSTFGKPGHPLTAENGDVHVWGYDERGSFNAVCGFLRGLGVRWYMPGDVGEVVPKSPSIVLPAIDETVRPDFDVRRFNIRFGYHSRETSLWAMRLGMRDPYGLRVAHGLDGMTHNLATFKAHPEWFGLYGGKRDNLPGERLNHLCYSNEEFFQETVQWARTLFDHYKFDTVSVMPPDAYISICQCPLCEGKDSPQRDYRGRLSNHIWDFVNRVAIEVGKTHPDKKILCCAYGANTLPPTNIKKLEPNVQVVIVGGRRPISNLPEQREQFQRLRQEWSKKTDNPLMIFENYPFTDRGFYLPAFVAQSLGDSINASKSVSNGEDIWLSVHRDFETKNIGFNHFMVYFTARMYWGGPQQDVTAMLDEYCRLFYGPAGERMKAFFEYCESNWQAMEKDIAPVNTALEMFAAAQAMAPEDSIYAKRLAFIDEYLESLRNKSKQLARKRGPVPRLRMVWDASDIVIDGKLDEKYWQECPVAATGSMRELQTGRLPTYATTFKSGWGPGGNLYFAIRCEERPGQPLNIGTKKNEDQAMWYGDVVEILLETESHAYYQFAVNPVGALIDLDRGASKSGWFRWQSQAEVATHVADDHWTVEIRIPVTDDDNDPLNQVIGRKPTESLPWYINLCRQRVREDGSEYSAFSPTGTTGFHEVMKFGHFYSGRSKQFPQAKPDDDYLHRRFLAEELYRSGKREAALEAFIALAASEGVSELQQADSLSQAAAAACFLKQYDKAAQIAEQVVIKEAGGTIRMENLLRERKAPALVEEFGEVDLAQWPFWNRGEAYFARGRGYMITKNGAKADADFRAALEFSPDTRVQLTIRRMIGSNQETNLQDDAAALQTFTQIAQQTANGGAADYFSAVQGAARILSRRKKFKEAIAVLDLVKTDRLKGHWGGAIRLSRGAVLTAADHPQAAIAVYQQVLNDNSATPQHKAEAKKAIAALR